MFGGVVLLAVYKLLPASGDSQVLLHCAPVAHSTGAAEVSVLCPCYWCPAPSSWSVRRYFVRYFALRRSTAVRLSRGSWRIPLTSTGMRLRLLIHSLSTPSLTTSLPMGRLTEASILFRSGFDFRWNQAGWGGIRDRRALR